MIRKFMTLLLMTVAVMSANAQAAGIRTQRVFRMDDFYTDFIEDRLSLGLRVSSFNFTNPKKKSYDENGNITGGYTRGISTYNLEERRSYFPTLYLLYKFSPYVALQVGWEHIEGRAWTMDYADPHYDGDVTLVGPSFEIQGRYPNDSKFTPYGAFGFAMLFGDFEEESSWYAGGRRRMGVDNTVGLMVTIGASAEIYENVEIDLSISSMGAYPDAKYWLGPEGENHPRAEWEFPASSIITQLGIRYMF